MLTRFDTSYPTQQRPPAFEIERRDLGGRCSVVAVNGELDLATAPRLKWMLLDSLEAGHTRLVVDLSRVSFIDSTALGVLVGVSRGLDDDARLALVSAGGEVLRIFDVSGMSRLFTICPTVERALAYVQGREPLGMWR